VTWTCQECGHRVERSRNPGPGWKWNGEAWEHNCELEKYERDERGRLVYCLRGMVEVPAGKRGYRWAQGYSLSTVGGNPTYPWLTKPAAQREARALGSRAVFVMDAELWRKMTAPQE
jgi:hypothetical protein